MSLWFAHRLNLKQASSCSPRLLIARAAASKPDPFASNPHNLDNGRPCYPPRKLDELISLLENGESANLSMLEWVHLIANKTQWDHENPEKAEATSVLIWKTAVKNLHLRRILFRRLIHYFNDREHNRNCDSLVTTFTSYFRKEVTAKDLNLKILDGFASRHGPKTLAEECKTTLKRPEEVMETAGFPRLQRIVESAYDCIVNLVLPKPSGAAQIDWLIDCFNQMELSQQVKSVDILLLKMSACDGLPFSNLLQWLKIHFSPRLPDSHWQKLSEEAKIKLRDWLGLVNYAEFEQIVDSIINLGPAYLNLKDFDINRLKKRKVFWRQYSNHFERIRVLLPNASYDLLTNFLKMEINSEVEELIEDGSEDTEICVFDFETCLITEFFRGRASEIRVFPKNSAYSEILFGSERLSIKLIRSIGGRVLDHVYLWQNEAERVLREECNIKPNETVSNFFQISEKGRLPYDRKKGILTQTLEDAGERDPAYQDWKRRIAKLEYEAIKYCKTHHDFSKILQSTCIFG